MKRLYILHAILALALYVKAGTYCQDPPSLCSGIAQPPKYDLENINSTSGYNRASKFVHKPLTAHNKKGTVAQVFSWHSFKHNITYHAAAMPVIGIGSVISKSAMPDNPANASYPVINFKASDLFSTRSRYAAHVEPTQNMETVLERQNAGRRRLPDPWGDPMPTPLDGSLVWLLIAIAAYGGKKLYYLSKNKDNSIE